MTVSNATIFSRAVYIYNLDVKLLYTCSNVVWSATEIPFTVDDNEA
jgi:hypothetical protein